MVLMKLLKINGPQYQLPWYLIPYRKCVRFVTKLAYGFIILEKDNQ